MLPLSAAGKRAFKTKTHMNLIIEFSDGTVLTNEDINSGTFTIEQSLCEEEQLTYGQVNSARFSVQVLKTEHRYINLKCVVYMCSGYDGVDANVYKVPVGHFTIINDERSDNRRYRTIEGYDAIYINAEKDVDTWYENLSLPMTLKEFRDSLFQYIGIPQADAELVNDDLIIERTVAAQTGPFTFLQVIEAICEVSATFGFMGQDGIFRYVTFEAVDYDELTQSFIFHKNRGVYNAETQTLELANGSAVYLPESETIMFRSNDFAVSDKQDIRQGSLIYKDYVVRPIEKIQIREDEQDYGTLYPNSAEAVNTYVITGNFLLYGNDYNTNYEVAKNIYEIAHGLTYVPLQVEAVGMPWVELGDWVEIQGVNNTFLIPILMRTMNGIVNYTDKYEARGTEYSSAQNNGVQSYLRQLKSKYLKLGANVDKAWIEIGALHETDGHIFARIEINAEAIRSEVSRATTKEQSIIEQTAQQLNLKVSKANAISEINMCPEEIAIKSDKISLIGYTSINNNFRIDEEGKMHCVDGDFSGRLVSWGVERVGQQDMHVVLHMENGILHCFYNLLTDDVYDPSTKRGPYMTLGYNPNLNGIALTSYVNNRETLRIGEGKIIFGNNHVIAQVQDALGFMCDGLEIRCRVQDTNAGTIYIGEADNNLKIRYFDGITIETDNFQLYSDESSQNTYIQNHSLSDSPYDYWCINQYGLSMDVDKSIRFYESNMTTYQWNINGLQGNGWSIESGKLNVWKSLTQNNSIWAQLNSYGVSGTDDDAHEFWQLDPFGVSGSGNQSSWQLDDHGVLGNGWSMDASGPSPSSDKRLKKNIRPLDDIIINIVGRLDFKQFQFKEKDDRIQLGIIAQDLIELAEKENIDIFEYGIITKFQTGYYGVNYEQLLVARNAYLEQKVDALEERLARLEKLLEV